MKTFSWNVIPCSGIQHKPLSFLAHSIAGRFRRFINNALGLFSLREVFKFGKEIIQIVHFVPLLFAAIKIAAILRLFICRFHFAAISIVALFISSLRRVGVHLTLRLHRVWRSQIAGEDGALGAVCSPSNEFAG
jgi:hypothetical protein